MRGKWVMGAASAALIAAVGFSGSAWAQQAEGADAANSTATRGRLAVDGSVAGTLSPAGDTDWYRVAVRPGQLYTFTLVGGEGDGALGDPYLVLYNASGEEITRNDDYDGLNSRIDYAATSRGNVFVEARGYLENAAGAYTLSLSAAALPPDNAGNDSGTRARIAPGATATGALDYAGDRDWFRVRLEAGQSYRFTLNRDEENDSPLGDPLIRLIGPNGDELAIDDDGGGGLNSYLEFTAATSGDHFVEARGFGEDATGAYRLGVGLGDIPADAGTDAHVSAEGDYRIGNLSPAGDRDWYRIDLEEGQTVRVSLESALHDPNALGDPYLAIYNGEGAQIAYNDDSGGSLNSRLEFVAPATGAYFIEARGYSDDAAGVYALNVLPGEIGNTIDTADYLDVASGGVSSQISPDGDSDWFMLDLIEGRPYRINLFSDDPSASFDPLLTLYDSEGNQIAQDDDGGIGLNSYLNYTSVTGGTFLIGVSSFADTGTGAYTLTVSDTDVPGHIGTDERLSGDEADERLGRIDIPGDADFFGADLVAGARYTITVSGAGDTPLADPFLTVSTGDGTVLATDDDSGPGLDASLRFAPTATDTYFLQVTGLGGSTGQYVLAVSRDAD